MEEEKSFAGMFLDKNHIETVTNEDKESYRFSKMRDLQTVIILEMERKENPSTLTMNPYHDWQKTIIDDIIKEAQDANFKVEGKYESKVYTINVFNQSY